MKFVAYCITCCLFAASAVAQSEVETILARQPGASPAEAAELAQALAALGTDAVAGVAAQLSPEGGTEDRPARYALSGLSKYGSAPGSAIRGVAVQGLLRSLDAATDPEVERFLMEQLQWIAGDEAVPAFALRLGDPVLGSPAANALQAIGTPAACTALAEALGEADEQQAVLLLTTLGSTPCAQDAAGMLPFTSSEDPAVREAAFFALANVGYPQIARAAASQPDRDLSLRLGRQLLADGWNVEAGRIAQRVLRTSTPDEPEHIAALQLLAQARGNHALGTLRRALRSDYYQVRGAAIRALAAMETERGNAALARAFRRKDPVLRTDLLRILGRAGVPEAISAARENLEHPEVEVRLAAIEALAFGQPDDAFDVLFERRSNLPTAEGAEAEALDRAIDQVRPPIGPPLGPADDEGFVPIFNGRDFTGWFDDTEGYAIRDGAIVWQGGRKLYTVEDYADFTLRFEFKVTEGANNGIGIRMAPGVHASSQAMEIQILDDDAEKHADLKPYQYCGAIYGVAAPERGHLKPVGEWNAMAITAKGPRVTIGINGHTVVDADVVAIHAEGPPDEKEHPGLLRKTGRIALLGHGTEVWFRNLRVKRL